MTHKEIESLLLSTMLGKFSSLSIFCDPHKANYESVEEHCCNAALEDDWWSPAERELAVANNTCWLLQIYPTTPLGFHYYLFSSFTSLCLTLPTIAERLEKSYGKNH